MSTGNAGFGTIFVVTVMEPKNGPPRTDRVRPVAGCFKCIDFSPLRILTRRRGHACWPPESSPFLRGWLHAVRGRQGILQRPGRSNAAWLPRASFCAASRRQKLRNGFPGLATGDRGAPKPNRCMRRLRRPRPCAPGFHGRAGWGPLLPAFSIYVTFGSGVRAAWRGLSTGCGATLRVQGAIPALVLVGATSIMTNRGPSASEPSVNRAFFDRGLLGRSA